LLIAQLSFSQEHDRLTWTYTYIKAKENQKENLMTFLKENWLAMDKVAVEKGLFKSYMLVENLGSDSGWDFMVAVEYFTRNTFAEIEEEWNIIRSEHKKVLINGLDFGELATIVNSEVVAELND